MSEDRPNVIILYPDQMRFDVMGCVGHPQVKTPNMDRLASEGIRFDHAYPSYPLCCPFRASVMTGKYAHSNGMCANHYPIPLGQTFLAEVFRDHGYRTGYVGKWHLDGGIKHGYVPPERRLGFDSFVGFNRGHEYFDSIFFREDDPRPRRSKRYEPDFQTDHLIEFLEKQDDRPFFGMVSWGPPHPPLVMPDHYAEMYSPDEVPVRENTPDTESAREFLAKYYGMVTAIDDYLGRLLDYMDENGLSDNTIIYFVSDHGEMAGEHDLSGKRTIYEASMRVPLIVRWPRGLRGGRVEEALVDPGVDTMPTLLDLCGIEVPDSVQGVSLVPLLEEREKEVRVAVFYEKLKESEGPEQTPIPERGVRTHDWVYSCTEDAPKLLFELNNDPLERENLAASDDKKHVIDQLDGMLKAHMEESEDDWGIEAVFPPPNFQTHGEGAAYFKKLFDEAILED